MHPHFWSSPGSETFVVATWEAGVLTRSRCPRRRAEAATQVVYLAVDPSPPFKSEQSKIQDAFKRECVHPVFCLPLATPSRPGWSRCAMGCGNRRPGAWGHRSPTSPFLPPRALPCGFSHAVGSVACVVPVPPAGIGAFQGQEPRLLVLFVISALEQVRENCGRGSDPRLSVGADSSIPHRNCQEADPLLEERGVLAGFSGPRDPPFALLQPGLALFCTDSLRALTLTLQT